MPVCRYYLQGNCKFGSACRFSHPASASASTSPLHNRDLPQTLGATQDSIGANRFHWASPASPTAVRSYDNAGSQHSPTDTPDSYVKILIQDAQEYTQSFMWPFSCYGAIKYAKCIFGFMDVSFEEERLRAFSDGNVERLQLYADDYSRRKNEARSKWLSFLHMSAVQLQEAAAIIDQAVTARDALLPTAGAPAAFSFRLPVTSTKQSVNSPVQRGFGVATSSSVLRSSDNAAPPTISGVSTMKSTFSFALPQKTVGHASGGFGAPAIPDAPAADMDTQVALGERQGPQINADNRRTTAAEILVTPQRQDATRHQQEVRPVNSAAPSDAAAIVHADYTPEHLLTVSEQRAYLAKEFVLGHLPTRPPPKEWC